MGALSHTRTQTALRSSVSVSFWSFFVIMRKKKRKKNKFAAICAVMDQLPSGAIQDLILEPGQEQYCSSGQIVGYADGTAINDIKCTSNRFFQ